MGARLKSIASIQTGLFLLPFLLFLWGWAVFSFFVCIYAVLTTGSLSPSMTSTFLYSLVAIICVAIPATLLEIRLVRSCMKQYDIKQVSVNLVVFLSICGFVAVNFQDYLNSLPSFITGG